MYLDLKNREISFNEFYLGKMIQLREDIFEEKICSIDELNNLLIYYPVKYLNVYLYGIEKNFIPIDNIEIGNNFLFYYDYCNNFIRCAINRIINTKTKKFNKINLEVSGFGAEFESRVNNALEKSFMDNITKRNVFALVGITNNTVKYVNNMRQNEQNFFYEYFELKKFNIFIDGIDKVSIEKEIFDIRNKNIFLHQVSNTGRSFDSALLLQIKNENFTHFLVLFQIKSKITISKTKEEYIKDSIKSKKYLEELYQGLSIKDVYFLFIIPFKMSGIDKTIKILEENKIYYIFYCYMNNKFCDIEGNKILNFNIEEARINDENIDFSFTKALSDNKKSKNIIIKAIKNYLGKKRIYNNKFINSYIKISEEILFSPKKIIIPVLLKKNILEKLYEKNYLLKDKHINFIFSSNYKGTKISELYNKTHNLILFSYNRITYFYYQNLFIIKEDYSIEETENLMFPTKNKKIVKPKQNIKFNDLINFPLFCFCFRIVIDYNFDLYF